MSLTTFEMSVSQISSCIGISQAKFFFIGKLPVNIGRTRSFECLQPSIYSGVFARIGGTLRINRQGLPVGDCELAFLL